MGAALYIDIVAAGRIVKPPAASAHAMTQKQYLGKILFRIAAAARAV